MFCYNITSPVTGKSTDLAFKFGKVVGLSLFDKDKSYFERFIHSNFTRKKKQSTCTTYNYACRTINAKLKLPQLIILKHKNNQFPT